MIPAAVARRMRGRPPWPPWVVTLLGLLLVTGALYAYVQLGFTP